MNSMSDNRVRDGEYYVVFFPSGYTGTPYRAHVCRWDRPSSGTANEPVIGHWVDHGSDHVGDYGHYSPVGWIDIPELAPCNHRPPNACEVCSPDLTGMTTTQRLIAMKAAIRALEGE